MVGAGVLVVEGEALFDRMKVGRCGLLSGGLSLQILLIHAHVDRIKPVDSYVDGGGCDGCAAEWGQGSGGGDDGM